jgi:hypothetical protein
VRLVDDECFLIDTRGRRIHHMNRLGHAVWRLIRRPMRLRDIGSVLTAAFPDTPPQNIRADLARLCKLLTDEGLARRQAGRMHRRA